MGRKLNMKSFLVHPFFFKKNKALTSIIKFMATLIFQPSRSQK